MKIGTLTYYWLDTWVFANVIQLATQDFCRRFLNLKNDPCGRQYDQMTQAARSGTANIAEGATRHYTSRETEMKLVDVARASLAELANDYTNWLLQHEQTPWSIHEPQLQQIQAIQLDKITYNDDVLYQSSLHILAQKKKFDEWLKSDDSLTVARCILILCDRLILMLNKQLEASLQSFTEQGGFTEALSNERLKFRTEESLTEDAPLCPKCGKPMLKRMAKKGVNSGKPFWSCSAYPNCNGTRKFENS